MSNGEAPVEIVPYDPVWPRLFEEEQDRLLHAVGRWLSGPVEHIGSTAIPGLAAKPVIDIIAGVETLEGSRPAIDVLAHRGNMTLARDPGMMKRHCGLIVEVIKCPQKNN